MATVLLLAISLDAAGRPTSKRIAEKAISFGRKQVHRGEARIAQRVKETFGTIHARIGYASQSDNIVLRFIASSALGEAASQWTLDKHHRAWLRVDTAHLAAEEAFAIYLGDHETAHEKRQHRDKVIQAFETVEPFQAPVLSPAVLRQASQG